MLESDWIGAGLLTALAIALLIWWDRRHPLPVPIVPPALPVPASDPFAQLTAQTGVISGWLKIYQDQITALGAQMDRIEREKRDLFERADKAEASNRALGDRLILLSDHIDMIYRALEQFQEGRGWVAGFRRDDPRYRGLMPPIPPPPPPPI